MQVQDDVISQSAQHQQQVIEEYLQHAPPNPTTYNAGDLVLLKPGAREKYSKLQPRWLGPMAVVGMVESEYQLQDLNTHKIKLVHPERLKIYVPDAVNEAANVATWDGDETMLDKIVAHKSALTPARWKFQCRWVDYGSDQDTWEPFRHVKHTEAFARYVHDHDLTEFPKDKYPLSP
jgi:hypothetical protein